MADLKEQTTLKDQLDSCSSVAESYEVFRKLKKDELADYVNTLEKASEYLDLDIRYQYLLDQAKAELSVRII